MDFCNGLSRLLAFWLSGLLGLWLSCLSNAWGKLEFAGSLENRIELIRFNDSSPLNPDNQILLLADISDQLRLRLSVDTAAYSATGAHARISYFDNLTDTRFRHEALVDEAFLNLNLPFRVNCIVGKKRLAWGTSFLWNPIDVLLPPKNPQEPEPEENREGALLVKFERSFGDATLTGTIAPEVIEGNSRLFREENKVHARLKNTQLIGKVDWLAYDTDLTGLVHLTEEREWHFGISFSRVFFGATEIHGELIAQRGFMRPSLIPGIASPSLATFGLPWSAKTLSASLTDAFGLRFSPDRQNDNSIVVGFVLGLHHSFPSNTRLIIEYYHNDEGYSSAEIDQLVNVLQTIHAKTEFSHSNDFYFVSRRINSTGNEQQYFAGVNQEVSALTGNLRKNYAYIRLMQPRLDEVFTLEGNVLWNLDDKSMLLFAEGEYETETNIFVFLRADIPVNFTGKETSEFGGLGVRNLSLRLGAKVYF